MIGELDQRACGDDLDFRAGPRCFGSASGRADQAVTAGIGPDGGRQDTGDRRDRTVKAELAEHGETGQRIMRDGANRRHQPERNRQIVVAAFLGQIGGREIDSDAAGRQSEPRSDQRRAHPFARLRNRLIGQADDGECGHARRNLHLHVDRPYLNASKATVATRWTILASPQAHSAQSFRRTDRAYCAICIGSAQP